VTITLDAAVSSRLRVEGSGQFNPLDIWVLDYFLKIQEDFYSLVIMKGLLKTEPKSLLNIL
jgi:hypothetical protein